MTEKSSIRMPRQIRSYQVSKLLGCGGMGEVFLANHDLLDRPVAIKRFALTSGPKKEEQQNRDRFLREGKALAKLHHNGIVGVHDLFEHRNELFMVLEYVDGYSLASLLDPGPLPIDITCIIGLQLAGTLEHAHGHGVIHRDIKASNVMLSRDGQVKLMDFGIARGEVLEKVTQTGLVVGTPMYLAPEVLAGSEPNPLSDVYGVGTLLYHCLSGRGLFSDNVDQNLYHRVQAGNFIPLKHATKEVPRQLLNLVNRCLALNPDKRFGSAPELRQELALFMSKQKIFNHTERLLTFIKRRESAVEELTTRSTKTAPPIVPKQQRRKYLGILLALLVLSAGVFVLWYWKLFNWQ